MPDITRSSGLRIIVPDTYRAVDTAASVQPGRRVRRSRPTGPVPLPGRSPRGAEENDSLLGAFASQDMQLVDTVELEPTAEPTPGAGPRRTGARAIPAQQLAHLEMDLASHEDAVVLLEQDGMYSWTFATSTEVVPTATTTRGRPLGVSQKRVRFELEINAARPTASEPRSLSEN